MKKEKPPKKPMTPEMVQMANAKLFDYLQSQNFNSLEEIQEFIDKNVNGKRIDKIVPAGKSIKTDIEKSDDLLYKAYDSDPKTGERLAKEALKLNPDNINALNYLAAQKDKPEDAIIIYKQAVEIGAKQLGNDFFIENKGHFWFMNETRPYMTARLSYADCLYALDKKDEAIKEYGELLELNPNDNQGVRHTLSSALLKSKKFREFEVLYKKYENECSTFWLFNYALYLFATQGESEKTFLALKAAEKANSHVIPFLTVQKKINITPIDYYSPGDENEASFYLMNNIYAWLKIKGTAEMLIKYVDRKNRQN